MSRRLFSGPATTYGLNTEHAYQVAHFASKSEWKVFFKETLRVPESIHKSEFWQSLSSDEYGQIYTQASNCSHLRDFDWAQLNLTDALLLLGNVEKLSSAKESDACLSFDYKLLLRASEISTLGVVQFFVETQGIKPRHDALRQSAAHNSYETMTYLADSTGLSIPLLSVLLGGNYTVAARLMDEGAETNEMFYIQAASRDIAPMLRCLVEHDRRATQYLEKASKAASARSSLKCIAYLEEQQRKKIADDHENGRCNSGLAITGLDQKPSTFAQ